MKTAQLPTEIKRAAHSHILTEITPIFNRVAEMRRLLTALARPTLSEKEHAQQPPVTDEYADFDISPHTAEQIAQATKSIQREQKELSAVFLATLSGSDLLADFTPTANSRYFKEKNGAYNAQYLAILTDHERTVSYLDFAAPFDEQNRRNWSIAAAVLKPLYLFRGAGRVDTEQYRHINKKTVYNDITPLQVLKILLNTHKINRRDFQEAKHRAEQHKKQRPKISEMVSRYYSTIKSRATKNTMTRLIGIKHIEGWTDIDGERKDINRHYSQFKPFVLLSMENGSRYRVDILRRAYHNIERWEELRRDGIDEEMAKILATEQTDLSFMDSLMLLAEAKKTEERRARKVAEIAEAIKKEHMRRLLFSNLLIGTDE